MTWPKVTLGVCVLGCPSLSLFASAGVLCVIWSLPLAEVLHVIYGSQGNQTACQSHKRLEQPSTVAIKLWVLVCEMWLVIKANTIKVYRPHTRGTACPVPVKLHVYKPEVIVKLQLNLPQRAARNA